MKATFTFHYVFGSPVVLLRSMLVQTASKDKDGNPRFLAFVVCTSLGVSVLKIAHDARELLKVRARPGWPCLISARDLNAIEYAW